ncbi:MAG TPA: hypothetical protein VKI17_07805, partial [Gemmataceae bacterium]|nr:hypothetical protein [Gemmataceae bacterium]
SALIVTAAAQLLPSVTYKFTSLEAHSAWQLDEEQVRNLRANLKEATAALAQARKLKDFPNGRYPVAWSEDAISTLLPHLQRVRELANLLSADALLRAHDKDLDGALESCLANLNGSRSIGDEPTYISTLVRVAVRAVVLGRLEQVLSQGEPSEAALAAIQKAWEAEEQVPLFLAAARGERAVGDRVILALQHGKMSSTTLVGGGPGSGVTGNASVDRIINYFRIGSLTTNRAALLELHHDIIEAAQLPEMERKQRFDKIRVESVKLPWLARLLVPSADKVAQAMSRSAAQMRTLIAALAAERYRQAHGRWPESLAVLVPQYLREVPLDPFDGKPLRLRRLSDGLVIYSVGLDGLDNGGTLTNNFAPGTDIGVRLWNVEQRRQPPEPIQSEDKEGKN